MLRELKKYTAECDAQVGSVDCMEIIEIEAPDALNARLTLVNQGWAEEEHHVPGLQSVAPWYTLSCPACQAELEFQNDTPFSGPLAAEQREEARNDYAE